MLKHKICKISLGLCLLGHLLPVSPQSAQASSLEMPRTQPLVSESPAGLAPLTRQRWQAHVEWSESLPTQPGCAPYYLKPRQKPAKGVVILLHGFTACAQQYDNLAPLLAQDGFHVFVPRLPGHGLIPQRNQQGWRDNLGQTPRESTREIYQSFSAAMGRLAEDEAGVKIIGGLSLGGSLAASAVQQSPGVFQRALIMTPLFDIVEPQNLSLPTLNALLPQYRIHWGPICDQERLKHRGGYCEFEINHLRALQRLGLEVLAQSPRLGTRVQLVGVEGDDAASNGAILKAAQKMPFGQTCLYPLGTSHSMLSPYDNQHQDKFWLTSLAKQVRRFVSHGEHFPTTGPAREKGFQRCEMTPVSMKK